MKNINYLKFAILALILTACDNITYLDDPVDREHYYKLYGSYDNDFVNSVTNYTNSDGGLMWVGYRSTLSDPDQAESDFEATPYICKVLSSGMVEWDTNQFNGYDKSIAHDLIFNSQDAEIYVSISQKISEDTMLLHLLPMTAAGEFDTTFSTPIAAQRIISANLINSSEDSLKVLVQAENIAFGITTTSIYVYSLTAGNVLTKSFEYSLANRLPEPAMAVYLADNTIVMTATTYENASSTGNTDVLVMNISDKDVLWKVNYGEKGVSETASDLKILDNKIVIAGNYISADGSAIHTLSIDVNTQIGEFTQYDLPEYTDLRCNSFDQNATNNYVFTGYFTTSTDRTDIFFAEATQSGEILQHKTFGTNGEQVGENKGSEIISIDNTTDYYLVGQFEPITNIDVVIFKLDEYGSWLN